MNLTGAGRIKFVLWWDGQEKQQGARGEAGPGRGNKTALQTADAVLPQASDFGLDRDTIHRWRSRLKTDDNFPRGCRSRMAILTHESVTVSHSGATCPGRQELDHVIHLVENSPKPYLTG